MIRYVQLADRTSAWFGKAFAWTIMIMAIGTGYEVVVRYVFNAPTSWSFDLSYIMYGTLFMMGGAYTLSRNGHVRGDFLYRLWRPRTQAWVELVLYIIFFFPGILLVIQGIAQVFRCIICIRTGEWLAHEEDVEELEDMLLKEAAAGHMDHAEKIARGSD